MHRVLSFYYYKMQRKPCSGPGRSVTVCVLAVVKLFHFKTLSKFFVSFPDSKIFPRFFFLFLPNKPFYISISFKFMFPFQIKRYFHVIFFCVNRPNIVPFKTFSKFKFTSQIQRFCHFSFFLCQPNKLFFI